MRVIDFARSKGVNREWMLSGFLCYPCDIFCAQSKWGHRGFNNEKIVLCCP